MENRLYCYERYAQRLFDWNAERFPACSWLEFVQNEHDIIMSLELFDSTIAFGAVPSYGKHSHKKLKRRIKLALRMMAIECDQIADWN